jgi:hypothetical protein
MKQNDKKNLNNIGYNIAYTNNWNTFKDLDKNLSSLFEMMNEVE